MTEFQQWISGLLLWMQLLCAVTAILTFRKVRHTYWKWFAYYIVLIFFIEAFSRWGLENYPKSRQVYYEFFGIPVEFLFLFWLYGKSLHRKRLFWIFVSVYVLSFIPHEFFKDKGAIMYSMNYTIGTFLLMILVCLEFYRQIQTENILHFSTDKMFYINTGVILFYIGTLPLFAFYGPLYKDFYGIWSNYFTFFLTTNNLMYLLFTASFIWGKPNTPSS
ncbi:MAG TPA: hypothetical protein VK528_07000 [Flavobacterium sp.]|nr:hypothetical protein [Flavobacterium sp.]